MKAVVYLLNKTVDVLYIVITKYPIMSVKYVALLGLFIVLAGCDRSKPKPISNNITKTTVVVNGHKDSVINNPQKNYGNATVSEPCVKVLIGVIQLTKNYKMLTTKVDPQNLIYNVNWITSSKPVAIGDNGQIVNGMAVDIKLKDDGSQKKLTTFLYNNENARIYMLNSQNKYDVDSKVDPASLKQIRNACFWGVASSK
jgi:hypothetical protein